MGAVRPRAAWGLAFALVAPEPTSPTPLKLLPREARTSRVQGVTQGPAKLKETAGELRTEGRPAGWPTSHLTLALCLPMRSLSQTPWWLGGAR